MDWLIWQLADSAFPSGGFAHSAGLEAAWQQGEVDGVEHFVRQVITQSGYGALPLVGAAHERAADLADLDAQCDAFLSNSVANRASRIQGRAFLLAARRAFPSLPEFSAMHYAPLFGAICGVMEIDRRTTQALFLQIACRSVLAAAVRLGVIGSNAAQRLQADLAPHLQETLDRCEYLTPDRLAQTAPLIDLWQSMHDRIYSRLFQS
ncbi:MAG TPA: urease accessory UreF family protein [Thermoanaerobaculia bacterium]|nr:urease accessory UreF family protein [Thermoanaerobaculia bacterium]